MVFNCWNLWEVMDGLELLKFVRKWWDGLELLEFVRKWWDGLELLELCEMEGVFLIVEIVINIGWVVIGGIYDKIMGWFGIGEICEKW